MTTPLTRPDAASPRASAPASGPLVITGAAGGLGRAFAVEAARRGWALILTDVAPLEPLATHLSALGATVDTIRADLATADGRDRLFAALPPTGIGGLVNVAGVDYEGALVQLGRDELFDIVRVNVEATLDVTREVALRRDPARRFVAADDLRDRRDEFESELFKGLVEAVLPLGSLAKVSGRRRMRLDEALECFLQSESDRREDFDDVYDFAEAFDRHFKITESK